MDEATLWTSPNGRWVIHRAVRGVLYVTDQRDLFTDWPIRYRDGRIAYDWPERVPAYVKRQVARIMKEAHDDGDA